MASVTSVWNAYAGAKTQQLWVFYTTALHNLGLRTFTDNDGIETYVAEPSNTATGAIVHPAALISLNYRQAIRVYGFIQYTTTINNVASTHYAISQLSPVPRTLPGITLGDSLYPYLAGATDGQQGWVYYLNQTGGSGSPVGLYEKKLDDPSPPRAIGKSFNLLATGAANTTLAAAYDSDKKTRAVVFQSSESKIVYLDADQDTGPAIDGTDESRDGTPLAVVIYSAADGTRITTIYYVNDGKVKSLAKAVKIGVNAPWTLKLISNAPAPSSSTTLTVAADAAKQQNLVTFLTGDGLDSMVVYSDEWDDKSHDAPVS